MVKPWKCYVCFTIFSTDENHRPRILPCGHSFCSSCITSLLQQGTVGCISCLICHAQHAAPNAAHFPINYDAESLMIQLMSSTEQQKGLETAEDQEEEEEADLAFKSECKFLMEELHALVSEMHTLMKQFSTLQNESQGLQAMHMSLKIKLSEMMVENMEAKAKMIEAHGKYQELLDEGRGSESRLLAMMEQLKSIVSETEKRDLMNRIRSHMQEMERWIERSQEMIASNKTDASSDMGGAGSGDGAGGQEPSSKVAAAVSGTTWGSL
ncbi:tripartite motif-containing protein 5-like [Scylla paramamosain]|uniref:tripartite motif-containing protein 5-like n=1 Tax=Scylla paramamosain TaxID=85552 RepID=UPI0030838349